MSGQQEGFRKNAAATALLSLLLLTTAAVLWRAHNANLRFNAMRVLIPINVSTPAPVFGERPKHAKRSSKAALRAVPARLGDLVAIGDVSHLLEPEYDSCRQFIALAKPADLASSIRVLLDDRYIGSVPAAFIISDPGKEFARKRGEIAYVFRIPAALSPPADAWEVGLRGSVPGWKLRAAFIAVSRECIPSTHRAVLAK